MPKFQGKSESVFNELCNGLQVVFAEVVKVFDCSLLEGFRNEQKQNWYFDHKLSQVRWPGSKHNKIPAEAVDAYHYFKDAPHTRSATIKEVLVAIDKLEDREQIKKLLVNLATTYHFAGFVRGVAHEKGISIRWGGDWNGNFDLSDQGFYDLAHFEKKGG